MPTPDEPPHQPEPGMTGADPLPGEISKDHIGPVLISATGRSVWWTGRVAIGLRYESPRHASAPGQSALWLQKILLR